jgi:hypothetical protein
MTASLVKSMQPIIDAIGFDAAISLAARFGGTTVFLAANTGPRDPLVNAVGTEAHARLVAALGVGPLAIARCLSWLLARRNEEIVNRYLSGETQAELALRFNLTERHVRSILRIERADKAATVQSGLFQDEERIST